MGKSAVGLVSKFTQTDGEDKTWVTRTTHKENVGLPLLDFIELKQILWGQLY